MAPLSPSKGRLRIFCNDDDDDNDDDWPRVCGLGLVCLWPWPCLTDTDDAVNVNCLLCFCCSCRWNRTSEFLLFIVMIIIQKFMTRKYSHIMHESEVRASHQVARRSVLIANELGYEMRL